MARRAHPGAVVATLVAAVVLAGCGSDGRATPTPAGAATPATPGGPATPGAPATPRTPSPTPTPTPRPTASDWRTGPTVKGIDVSRYNPTVDWAGLAASGHRFVYVKATEGTGHRSPTFPAQWDAAGAAGLLRGAYHYARPASSDGATQARFLTDNGGRWTPDGRTLPGALDLEQSTSGPRCHGLTVAQMQRWVGDFSAAYTRLNGRPPVIYVKAEVWRECVGDALPPGGNPLWLYDHDGGPDPLPAGWERPTLWQRGVEANLDRNVFFGTEADLVAWASTG